MTYMYIHTCIHTHVFMYVCMYAYMYVCMYVKFIHQNNLKNKQNQWTEVCKPNQVINIAKCLLISYIQ